MRVTPPDEKYRRVTRKEERNVVVKYPDTRSRRHDIVSTEFFDEILLSTREENVPTLVIKGIGGMSGGEEHVKDDDSVRRRPEVSGSDEVERPHLRENDVAPNRSLRNNLLVVKKPNNKGNFPFHQDRDKFQKKEDTRKPIVETRRTGVSVNMSSENPLGDFSVSEDVVETPPTAGRKTLNEPARQNLTQPIDKVSQRIRSSGSGDGQQLPNVSHQTTPPQTEFNRTKVIRKVHAIAKELYGSIPMRDEDEIVPSFVYYTRRLCHKLFGKTRRRLLTDTEWAQLLEHLERLHSTYRSFRNTPLSQLNSNHHERK